MLTVPIPFDEEQRLADFARLDLLLVEPDAVLNAVTAELARVFDVPAAAISFIDRDTQYYKATVGVPEPFASHGEPRSESICSFVVGINDLLVVEDLAADERFNRSEAVTDFGLRFYAGAPLRADSGRAVGSLCILDRRPRTITAREREMLRIVAEGVMAQVKLQAALRKLFQHSALVDEELRRAVRVQRFMLPAAAIAESGWTVNHLYRPAAYLGGDFLDVIIRGDGGLALLIADVTGHGTDAALTAAMAKTAFARAVAEAARPADVLTHMNRELIRVMPPGQFMSAIAALLEPDSNRVELASAGHPQPLLVTPTGARSLAMDTNLLLGIEADASFDQHVTLQLPTGDRLLCFTDGAIEAPAPGSPGSPGTLGTLGSVGPSERLGITRLATFAHQAVHAAGDAFLDHLYHHINTFAGGHTEDDVALLEVRRGN